MRLKKWMACALAAVMTFAAVAAVPVVGEAAAKKPAAPNITGNEGFVKDNYVGLNFTWDKVKGAKGYQYRYNVLWSGSGKPSSFEKGTTKKTNVEVGFQDNEGVYFQVRAFKKTKVNKKTKTVYGKWATVKIKKKMVNSLIDDARKIDLNGSWGDTVSQRATLDMGVIGDGSDGSYLAIISWGSSYDTSVVWQLSGKLDQETGVFTYEGGTKDEVVYNEDGSEKSRKSISKDLSGTMTYDSETGKLTWNNSTGTTDLETDMVFEKYEYVDVSK